MSRRITPVTSQRWRFRFGAIPTVDGIAYPNQCGTSRPEDDYACVLDCTYEMACDITDANGVTPDAAISQVLKDEGWRILPTHRRDIIDRMRIRP
jgi:hypothetical protein